MSKMVRKLLNYVVSLLSPRTTNDAEQTRLYDLHDEYLDQVADRQEEFRAKSRGLQVYESTPVPVVGLESQVYVVGGSAQ